MCGAKTLRQRRRDSAMTRISSVLALAGSQRSNRSHMHGWSHRKAHLLDGTESLPSECSAGSSQWLGSRVPT